MMQRNVALARQDVLYDDVEAAILEQEAANPDWHVGFTASQAHICPAPPARALERTPATVASALRSENLAHAKSFAGLMLRRWLRTHDDRRAQFWRDVACAVARKS